MDRVVEHTNQKITDLLETMATGRHLFKLIVKAKLKALLGLMILLGLNLDRSTLRVSLQLFVLDEIFRGKISEKGCLFLLTILRLDPKVTGDIRKNDEDKQRSTKFTNKILKTIIQQ